MSTALGWPSVLSILRHGESTGNVADRLAHERGAEVVEVEGRDMDVPLSERGVAQARAFGRWLGRQPVDEQPQSLLCSPYVRTLQTARLVVEESGLDDLAVEVDERLREREFGVLDRLTGAGMRARMPQEWERRVSLGKFYHRPPGGESWADVALRLRLVVDEVRRDRAGERVLLVGHQVGVLVLRYVLEGLDERRLLEVGSARQVPNCSLTVWEHDERGGLRGRGGMRLRSFADDQAVLESSAPVTDSDDVPAGHR